ncbi:hypothetical protein [Polluticoccus soli]|uniref:hypothetical protein n=1 Tax=Polluticoccus soli TaxID=3034150 RepID=UPI0023E2F228|nr:hypothetical protein [Flavipsychrobacter sp. JY13-12]
MSKNLLSIAALAFSLFVSACSGSSNAMADREPITSADVPVAVLSAFNAKYPDAVDVTWGKGTNSGATEYKAAFMQDGKQKHAEYRERQGVVVED